MFRLLLIFSSILIAKASYFEERLKILENNFDKQQDEMDFLKRENVEFRARIEELELDVVRLSNKHDDRDFAGNLDPDIGVNENVKNKSNTMKTTDWNDSSNVSNRHIQGARTSLSKRVMTGSERVAFHVYLSSSKCVNDHQVIEYDTEVIDTGNGYNEHDGIYIVPESGMYVFTWTFLADYSGYAVTEIVINGVAKGWTISDGSNHRLLLNPSSCLILARVNAGDHVFIRRKQGIGCNAYSGVYIQPTFTGWKLSNEI